MDAKHEICMKNKKGNLEISNSDVKIKVKYKDKRPEVNVLNSISATLTGLKNKSENKTENASKPADKNIDVVVDVEQNNDLKISSGGWKSYKAIRENSETGKIKSKLHMECHLPAKCNEINVQDDGFKFPMKGFDEGGRFCGDKVLEIDSYTEKEISSHEHRIDRKYDEIYILSEKSYTPWLLHLNYTAVTILTYQKLNIQEIQSFILQRKKTTSKSALFLLVIGIYSIADSVKMNLCTNFKCRVPLQKLVLRLSSIPQSLMELTDDIHYFMKNVQLLLPPGSNISILPPLPISLIPISSHQQLHELQSHFPKYMIVGNKSQLIELYNQWMHKITMLSLRYLKQHLSKVDEDGRSLISKVNNTQYRELKEMDCKNTDMPAYVTWMDLLYSIIKSSYTDLNQVSQPAKSLQFISLPLNNSRFIKAESVLVPSSDVSKSANDAFTHNLFNSAQSAVDNSSSIITCCDKSSNIAALDGHFRYLVFIGHESSRELLPDVSFCQYSFWNLEDLNFKDLINMIWSFKQSDSCRILFIIIGDVSIFLSEEIHPLCSKNVCKRKLNYFNIFESYITLLHDALDKVRKVITDLKKFCSVKFNVVLAPLLPRNCIHINADLFLLNNLHIKMHKMSKSESQTSFFKSHLPEIDSWKALEKFENEWSLLPFFISEELPNNAFEIMSLTSIISDYTSKYDSVFHWIKVSEQFSQENYLFSSEWKSFILSLVTKAVKKCSKSDQSYSEVKCSSIGQPVLHSKPLSEDPYKSNLQKLSCNQAIPLLSQIKNVSVQIPTDVSQTSLSTRKVQSSIKNITLANSALKSDGNLLSKMDQLLEKNLPLLVQPLGKNDDGFTESKKSDDTLICAIPLPPSGNLHPKEEQNNCTSNSINKIQSIIIPHICNGIIPSLGNKNGSTIDDINISSLNVPRISISINKQNSLNLSNISVISVLKSEGKSCDVKISSAKVPRQSLKHNSLNDSDKPAISVPNSEGKSCFVYNSSPKVPRKSVKISNQNSLNLSDKSINPSFQKSEGKSCDLNVSSLKVPRKSIKIEKQSSINLSDKQNGMPDIEQAPGIRNLKDIFTFLHCLEMSKRIKKSSYCHSTTMFNHAFIVGKKELINTLSECNINSSYIAHNLACMEESDVQCILYKMGELPEKSVCCLVFDISIITKALLFSEDCLKHSCQKPLKVSALKIESTNRSDDIKKSEAMICEQLKHISTFVQKLSKYIPVIILPLYPARIFGLNILKTCPHEFSHSIHDLGIHIIKGNNYLWYKTINLITLAWNSLLEMNHENYESSKFISSYLEFKQNTFVILKKDRHLLGNWIEPDIWSAFVETLMLSLVPSRLPKNEAEPFTFVANLLEHLQEWERTARRFFHRSEK